jgi:hypothetical protein
MGTRSRAQPIRCNWCGQIVEPNAARMRLHESEGIRFSGSVIAHFHPECGDALLDLCEERQAQAAE